MNNPLELLNSYANEYPYSGINRANAAPQLFAAARAVINMHRPWLNNNKWYCECCQPAVYPCATVRAFTTALEASDA